MLAMRSICNKPRSDSLTKKNVKQTLDELKEPYLQSVY